MVQHADIDHTGLTGVGTGSGTASVVEVRNSTNVAVSTSGEAAVGCNTEDADTDGYHDTVTNNSRLTVPTGMGGKFMFSVTLRISANVQGYVAVRKNGSGGTILGLSNFAWNSSASFGTCTMSQTVTLAAADYIEMYNVAGGAANIVAAGGPQPWFSLTRIGS